MVISLYVALRWAGEKTGIAVSACTRWEMYSYAGVSMCLRPSWLLWCGIFQINIAESLKKNAWELLRKTSTLQEKRMLSFNWL